MHAVISSGVFSFARTGVSFFVSNAEAVPTVNITVKKTPEKMTETKPLSVLSADLVEECLCRNLM
jgi:hypothetical protein